MKKITLIVLMLFTVLSYAQGIELNGTVSAENNQIKNVADPTDAQDAATKAYIDALIAEAVAGLQSQIDDLESDNDDGCPPFTVLVYGTQEWSGGNACNITYRDGTPIPEVTDNAEWAALTTGAWAYYDNDPTKPRLYNWYAVAGIHDNDPNTPNKELAPEGWHVPSDAEWTTLEEHLIANGYNYDSTTTGNKIAKSIASQTGWISSTGTGAIGNDQSLNNSSGFNAFPEGYRFYTGPCASEGSDATFWSSTEFINENNIVFGRNLGTNYSDLNNGGFYKHGGFSVRFVRD